MNRNLLVSVLIFGLIFAGLATFNSGILAAAVILGVYLVAGFLYGPEEVNLEISREVEPRRVPTNTPVEITLTVTNKGKSLEEIFLEDRLPGNLEIIDGSNNILTEIKAGKTLTIRYQVQGRRGIYYFDGVHATANDHLNLFKLEKFVTARGSIFIMPRVPKIKRVAIRPRQTRVYSGTIPARIGGPGVEFFGVRDYHAGDAMHRINWRASARHNNALYSNEYMQERVTDIGLILDARQITNIQTSQGILFEHLVSATAAMTETLLNHGNRVGLLVYGHFLDWTYPRYGKIQKERIFHSLARAQIGDSLVFEKLDNLPTKMFPNNSQLILFSALQDDDVPILINLRARGYQVMVISPDPITFQLGSLPISTNVIQGARLANIERKLLFSKLRHAGIIVLNWDTTVPFDQAMQLSLSRLSLWSRPFMGGR